jgi:UDP-glucose 4-epimerase
MRILITGGFGFVGGRLAQHLQKTGHQVILGSRNDHCPPNWLPQAEVARTDWTHGCALEQICKGVDVVIQASGMNAQDCLENPVAALEVNGLATAQLLQAAVGCFVPRFIYLSTAHVYASPLEGTITESTCPLNLHPYATSHLAGENVVLSACQKGLIQGMVLRMSNAFGAPTHQDANCWMLLVNDLCKQAVETGKIVLQTSGLQQRDFIGMTEVCRVVDHVCLRDDEFPQPAIVNLGAGVSQSVLEMAQLVQKRCNLVLGFQPKLIRATEGAGERHEKLLYKGEKLLEMGIEVKSEANTDIDDLLMFCQATYGKNQDITQ